MLRDMQKLWHFWVGPGILLPALNLDISLLHATFIAPYAEVAQLVEHQLPKLRVAGSNLVFRSLAA